MPGVEMRANNMDLLIPNKLFINGAFVDAVGGHTFTTVNPTDETVICDVAEARKEDVDIAVAGKLSAGVFLFWSHFTTGLSVFL